MKIEHSILASAVILALALGALGLTNRLAISAEDNGVWIIDQLTGQVTYCSFLIDCNDVSKKTD